MVTPVPTVSDPEKKLYGKVAVVTGGTSGIGLALTKRLCKFGVTVVVGSIDAELPESEKTVTEPYMNCRKLALISLDLASFTSIQEFHAAVIKRYSQIDYLINNAGIMLVPFGHTKEGFERHLGVNFLGHAYLTKLFLPNMTKSHSMVLNVGSSTSRIGSHKSLTKGEFYGDPSAYSPHYQYGHSKLAVVLYTQSLALKLREENSNCSTVSVHPGVVLTSLYQHVYHPLQMLQQYCLAKWFMRTADEGAQVILRCLMNHDTSKDGSFYIFKEYRRPLAQQFDFTNFMRITNDAISDRCNKSR